MRKPKIIVSKCLDSQKCRYDGQGYNNKVISSLRDFCDVFTVCPEVEIGLSIPRETIRVETENDLYKLVQTKSKGDFTNLMNEFSEEFLINLGEVDAFILKGKSPSCGIKDVKVYHKNNDCSIRNNGNGFFAQKVLEKYPHLPIENEGRLSNFSVRDDFLTKIFLINDLKSHEDIHKFNLDHDILLKSYDKEKKESIKDKIHKLEKEEYEGLVYDIISTKRKREIKLSIVEDIFKKYAPNLTIDEVKMFKDLVKSFENEKIPFSTLCAVIRVYAIRFKDSEILNQSFFSPYPEDLINICDSGKGRKI
ncbi:MAG: DUF523 and DUF1722 domain-containing protein [Peptostreptococcaceae bacterium]